MDVATVNDRLAALKAEEAKLQEALYKAEEEKRDFELKQKQERAMLEKKAAITKAVEDWKRLLALLQVHNKGYTINIPNNDNLSGTPSIELREGSMYVHIYQDTVYSGKSWMNHNNKYPLRLNSSDWDGRNSHLKAELKDYLKANDATKLHKAVMVVWDALVKKDQASKEKRERADFMNEQVKKDFPVEAYKHNYNLEVETAWATVKSSLFTDDQKGKSVLYTISTKHMTAEQAKQVLALMETFKKNT